MSRLTLLTAFGREYNGVEVSKAVLDVINDYISRHGISSYEVYYNYEDRLMINIEGGRAVINSKYSASDSSSMYTPSHQKRTKIHIDLGKPSTVLVNRNGGYY
ncbi:MAG: hypothetical protein IJV22_01190 [Bacteroidales bacterium]|nr:hypothetical protein [Bacteroidales bacterium]